MWNQLVKRYAEQFEVETARLSELRQMLEERRPQRVCYVLRRPSNVEFALLCVLAEVHRLPVPTRMFGLSDLGSGGVPPSAYAIALRNRLGTELVFGRARRWRGALERRLRSDASDALAEETLWIPSSFFFGLGPQPIPGTLRLPLDFSIFPIADYWRVYLLKHHTRALRCLLGPAIFVQEDDRSAALRGALNKELYRHEKSVRGAPKQTAQTIAEIVLEAESVQAAISKYAETESVSLSEARAAARKRLREMSATVKGSVIAFFSWLLIPIIRRVFSSVEVVGLDRLRAKSGNYPIVLLPNHRSHFDYLIVSYVLFINKLSLPYIAAGINLNFWPFGPLARAAGGFFIRRSIGADFLYRAVLDAYLRYLAKRGHMLEFFIEGGRSRSGGMRQPRLGLLKYLIEGWRAGERKDMQLFPLGISYEKLVEERAIERERRGAQKRSESLLDVLRLWNIKRKRFGSVVVAFGEPLSLSEFFESKEGKPREWDEQTEDLAFELARRIEDLSALTNTSLGAAVVLSHGKSRCSFAEALAGLAALLRAASLGRSGDAKKIEPQFDLTLWAEKEGVTLSTGLQRAFAGPDLKEGLQALFVQLEQFGFCALEVAPAQTDSFVQVDESNRAKLSYYKNNSMHLFLPAALLAIAAGVAEPMKSGALYRLQQMCKAGFLLPLWVDWRAEVARLVEAAQRSGLLEAGEKWFSTAEGAHAPLSLTREGRRVLSYSSTLFRPYVESVLTCLELLQLLKGETVTLPTLRTAWDELYFVRSHYSDVGSVPLQDFAVQYALRNNFMTRLTEAGQEMLVVRAEEGAVQRELEFLAACQQAIDTND